MNKREAPQKDQIISPLIEQGQSPYHILAIHSELDMYKWLLSILPGNQKNLADHVFAKEKLFLAFLMNRYTKDAVLLVFDRLVKRMGTGVV